MPDKQEVLIFIRHFINVLAFITVILLLSAPSANGADLYWNASLADWSSAASWGGKVPLSTDNAYINNSGTALVTLQGQICQSLFLGDMNSGAIQMSGGGFGASNFYIGNSGVGNFTQSAGSVVLSYNLYLGYNTGATGTYNLSETGGLNAQIEYIGYNATATGLFQQSGGTNTAKYLTIGTTGHYLLTGGTLNINGGLDNQGILDFGDGNAVLSSSNSIINLARSGGVLKNTQAASLIIGSNALLIVPAGFDPATNFASYSNAGLIHTLGTTLAIASGQGFSGWGNLDDQIACQGTITASSGGSININNSLSLFGNGNINLGGGVLRTEDTGSGMSGGTLVSGNHYVGRSGTGQFVQSAGSNTTTLYLGYDAGSKGTYILSNGQLKTSSSQFIGYSGTGSVIQSGGTNSITNTLILGYSAGANGTYTLTDTGQLTASSERIGLSGIGTFVQSSGINKISNSLILGSGASANGTYRLSGTGQLISKTETIGTASVATGLFEQSGGTNTVSYLTILPMGQYIFTGGKLQVNGGMENQGVLDFGGGNAVLNASNSILNLARLSGLVKNTQSASLSLDANSLLIVPAGFDPTTSFANYNNAGLLHTLGTTITVASGRSFSGWGNIDDPVSCQGSITAVSGGSIQLNNGLSLSGTGNINLGSGVLRVDDLISGINGGSLTVAKQYVGTTTTGVFNHAAGSNTMSSYLYLGDSIGANGTYNLSNSGQLRSSSEFVGNSGWGTFTHSGGTNTTGSVSLGYNTEGNGTYNLSDSAQLNASSEYIGYSGTGSFVQTGGMNTISGSNSLYLGYNAGSSGTYVLSNQGKLTATNGYVGYSSTGIITQNGGTSVFSQSLYLGYNAGAMGTYNLNNGTNTISGNLYLGYSAGSSSTFVLGGASQLSAVIEYVGYNDGANALFQQSGGVNSASFLSISRNSSYLFTGGTMQITKGLDNQGTLDFGGGSAVINVGANAIVNLARAGSSLKNAQASSINIGANSLLIVPAGFDPTTGFGSYSNAGILHQVGTTLTLSSDQSISGLGTIEDSVACQGKISALSGGYINLTHGLSVSGTGSVSLGTGFLQIEDGASGINGGTLSVADHYVGRNSTGTFAHVAGTNIIANSLYLGYDGSGNGTYTLDGTGQVSVNAEYIGVSGVGTFTHSLGTNTIKSQLMLGVNSGSQGTYQLIGPVTLSGVREEDIGVSGTGTFQHSMGTNSPSQLILGVNANSVGIYELSGTGQLIASDQYIGSSGTGTFSQTGGTNSLTFGGSVFYVGYNAGSVGTYNLSGAGLLMFSQYGDEYIGFKGTGIFNQSGGSNILYSSIAGSGNLYLGYNQGASGTYNLSSGVNTLNGNLYLGYLSGAKGTYNLSGTGQFTAKAEYVGFDAAATGVFQQSGGTNAANYVSIGPKGQYLFAGGNLQITGGLDNQGILDFDGGPAVLNAAANSLVNLARTGSLLKNTQAASLTIGANSLLIVPAGFDPAANFANYSNGGLVHTLGTTLTIANGQGFSGWGSIDDHTDCQGNISATTGGFINLFKGLTLSDTANVNLGGGELRIDNTISEMSGGSLRADKLSVGYTGTGSFIQSSGTNHLNTSIYVGYYAGSNGTFVLNGTGDVATAADSYIGYFGKGTFTQTGGKYIVSIGSLYLGKNLGSVGIYDLSGGSLDVQYAEYIGNDGIGTFNHSGGTNESQEFTLNNNSTYNLSGTGSLTSTIQWIYGTFNQSGGTNSSFHKIGGTYNLSGGELIGSVEVSNTFNHTGGKHSNSTVDQFYLTIVYGGTYNLSGFSSWAEYNSEYIGDWNKGTFNHSGGTNKVAGDLYIGNHSGSNGTYNLSDSGILSSSNEYIGYSGTGIVSQSGGTNAVSNTLTFGFSTGSNGTYNLTGGSLIVKSMSKGSGTVLFNFGGGTLQASGNFATNIPIILTGIKGIANVDSANYTIGFSGVLSGPGGLNKQGAGILKLLAANTYEGPTAILGGTLKLDGVGTIGSSSIITVGTGAVFDVSSVTGGFTLGSTQTLKGNGSVLGAVAASSGSIIEPGESPGTLTLNGNLTLNDGVRLGFDLDSIANSDKIMMSSSTLLLNNQEFSDFTFNSLSGFGMGTYTLIDAGMIQGYLGGNLSGTIDGLSATLALSGNDLVINVVPEPSSIVFCVAGALSLLAYSWQRRK